MYVFIYTARFGQYMGGWHEQVFEIYGFGDGSHCTPQEGDEFWVIPI